MSNKDIPQYQCHKIVRAAKIERITVFNTRDGAKLLLSGGIEVSVSDAWIERAKQSVSGAGELIGGYFVSYEDGHESWSPAKAFEEGYRPVLTDWRDRVRAEKAELDERTRKLAAFSATEMFGALPYESQALMIQQGAAMVSLSSILALRIEQFSTADGG